MGGASSFASLRIGGCALPHYVDVVIKSVFAFVALVLVCRLVGQKFDIVLPTVLGALAAVVSLDRSVSVLDGLITVGVWGVMAVGLKLVVANFRSAGDVVNGKPTVIIENGQVLEKNLRKSRLTVTDLMAFLRERGAFALADVEMALLEPDGQMSVLKKSSLQPVTPRTAGIAAQDQPGPKIVIQDGQVMVSALHELGLSVGWLLNEVQKQGANDFSDVFLAQIDANNSVYVDLINDPTHRQPADPNVQSRLLLLASLKKTQADYEHFGLETQNEGAKRMYEDGSIALQKIIENVQAELTKQ